MAIGSLKQLDLRLERSLLNNETQPTSLGDDAKFSEALARASAAVVEPQQKAAEAVKAFEKGHRNIHETLLAIEKSDISLKYMMGIKNKLLDAYREVMQMGA